MLKIFVNKALKTEEFSNQPRLFINKNGCKTEIKSAFEHILSFCDVLVETPRKTLQVI